MNKKIHVVNSNKLVMGCYPEYNFTFGELIAKVFWDKAPEFDITLYQQNRPDDLLQGLVEHKMTKIIVLDNPSSECNLRTNRKDIFVCAIQYYSGKGDAKAQYIAALNFLKENSHNLVLSINEDNYFSMIVTPEEAHYHDCILFQKIGDVRGLVENFVEMILLRSHLTFTRSTVVAGEPIDWNSDAVPNALREVVNYCIKRNAYKPFRGATVGHFACKVNDTTFLTSRRKTNFNDLDKIGLVKITTDGPDSVLAYGSKPSVGGQSQRIIFHDHQDYDCVVHFHCPIKEGSLVPQVSQREVECGSHQCGRNTSNGLKKMGNLSAVYLQQHGPNIVFHSSIDPKEVIDFIESNFNLDEKTGGYVS